MVKSKAFKAIKGPKSLIKGDLVLLNLDEEGREELVVFLEYSETPVQEKEMGMINCRVMSVKMSDNDSFTNFSCGEMMNDWGFKVNDPNFKILSRFEE